MIDRCSRNGTADARRWTRIQFNRKALKPLCLSAFIGVYPRFHWLLRRSVMSGDTLLGCAVIACALGVIVGLTLWSRRAIDWIARSRAGSAREILKQRNER